MSLTLRADRAVAAPPDAVWAALTDVDKWERIARKRDPDLARSPPGPVGEGTRWTGTFPVAGKARRVKAVLARLDEPRALRLDADADGIAVAVDATVAPEGDGSRLALAVEARGTSMGGRVAVKTMSLAEGQMRKVLEAQLDGFAKRVEAENASSA